jgi:hypothetical protein
MILAFLQRLTLLLKLPPLLVDHRLRVLLGGHVLDTSRTNAQTASSLRGPHVPMHVLVNT